MNRKRRREIARLARKEARRDAVPPDPTVVRAACRELTLALFEVDENDGMMRCRYPDGVHPHDLGTLVAKIVKKHAGATS